jgi:hypothetical protein
MKCDIHGAVVMDPKTIMEIGSVAKQMLEAIDCVST